MSEFVFSLNNQLSLDHKTARTTKKYRVPYKKKGLRYLFL